jgi:putative phage-type endonuclease
VGAIETIEMNAEVEAFTGDMERADWLALRRTGIGGSDAASVLGLGYHSPYRIWADKTEQLDAEDATNIRMRCGQLMEPVIAQLFTEDTGIAVQTFPYLIRSKRWPHMIVNLDAIAHSPEAVGEWKTADKLFARSWEDEDGNVAVPDAYMIQGQHELAVTGLPRVYFGVLIGGNDFRVVHVERDELFIENLAVAEQNFWSLVERLEAPDPDGSQSTTDALKQLYPRSEPGSRVELPDYTAELLTRLNSAKVEVARAVDHKAGIENKIKTLMGSAETGTINGQVAVTWKSSVVREHVRKESVRRPLIVK